MTVFLQILQLVLCCAFLLFPGTEQFLNSVVFEKSWKVAAIRTKRSFLTGFDRFFRTRTYGRFVKGSSLGRLLKITGSILLLIVVLPFALQVIDLFYFLSQHGMPAEYTGDSLVLTEPEPLIRRIGWANQNHLYAEVFDEVAGLLVTLGICLPIIPLFVFVSFVKTRFVGSILGGRRTVTTVLILLLEVYLSLNLAIVASNVVAAAAYRARAHVICAQTPYVLAIREGGEFEAIEYDCTADRALVYAYGGEDLNSYAYGYSPNPIYLARRFGYALSDLSDSFNLIIIHDFHGELRRATSESDALFHAVANVGLPALGKGPAVVAAAAAFSVVIVSLWLLFWSMFGALVWLAGKQPRFAAFVARHRGYTTLRELVLFAMAFPALLAMLVELWLSKSQ